MPKFNMTIGHNLTQDEAVKRITSGLEDIKRQFADKIDELQEKWNGNTCEFSVTAMGFTATGTMNVKDSEIEIAANLPFAAFIFKNQIESAVREKLNEFLNL
jgi:hypothetical protein